jgi:hypothetical protein
MIYGPGLTETYPVLDDNYLPEAFQQTPLEEVLTDEAHFMSVIEAMRGRRISPIDTHGPSPFMYTTVLNMLNVDRNAFYDNVAQPGGPDEQAEHVLLFARNSEGNYYSAIGDILGAAGYPVTVASPDEERRQNQLIARPNITYATKSMGALGVEEAEKDFDLVILDHQAMPLSAPDISLGRPDVVHHTSMQRMRGLLGTAASGGQIIIANDVNHQALLSRANQDQGLADQLDTFTAGYLKTYDPTSRLEPFSKPPYYILEKS